MKTTINLNKAIDTVLNKGDFILVYPEQSMWWNYRKPRKFQVGAFRWASRNNVPVIPCFTTMEDMDEYEENGLKKQKLTFHIGKPIYPKEQLSMKANADFMLTENHKYVVSVFENFYNQKYNLNI